MNWKSKYLKYKLKLQKLNSKNKLTGGSDSSASSRPIIFNYDFFTSGSNRQVYRINDFLTSVYADFFTFRRNNHIYEDFKQKIMEGLILNNNQNEKMEMLSIADDLLQDLNNIYNPSFLNKILKLYGAELRTESLAELRSRQQLPPRVPGQNSEGFGGLASILERRYGLDGEPYTLAQFIEYYDNGVELWDEAEAELLASDLENTVAPEHIVAPGNAESPAARAMRLLEIVENNFPERYSCDGSVSCNLLQINFGLNLDGTYNLTALYLVNRDAWNALTDNMFNDEWDFKAVPQASAWV
jgi:hypothetical protein